MDLTAIKLQLSSVIVCRQEVIRIESHRDKLKPWLGFSRLRALAKLDGNCGNFVSELEKAKEKGHGRKSREELLPLFRKIPLHQRGNRGNNQP